MPLVAVPVAIHLMHRRSRTPVRWGAMQFLQTAATQRQSRRRLDRWLHVLLRMLAIAGLIIALARPLVFGGSVDRGAGGDTEVLVLVDQSLSTSTPTGRQPRLESIWTLATSAADKSQRSRMMTMTPTPRWLEASEIADGLQPLAAASDPAAALMIAVQSPPPPGVDRRRILVVGDRAASDWRLDDAMRWRRFDEVCSRAAVSTTIELLFPPVPPPGGNLSLVNLDAPPVVGVDQPWVARATVRCTGEVVGTRRVSWSVDGQPVKTGEPFSATAEQADLQTLRTTFDSPGLRVVTARIHGDDQDDFPADDWVETVVRVVDQIPILIVDDGEGLTPADRDAFFTRAALGDVDLKRGDVDANPADAGGQPRDRWRSIYRPRVIDSAEIDRVSLEDFDAMVVPHWSSPSRGAIESLERYVRDGGGLWIGLGPRTDVRLFNALVHRDGEGLSPVGLVGPQVIGPGDTPPSINPYLGAHESTGRLIDPATSDLADVLVRGRMMFDPGSLRPATPIWLGLSDGEPLVVEHQSGQGRVIVCGLPLSTRWSTLVRSESFVVMVGDWLDFLTRPRQPVHVLNPGQPLTWTDRDNRQMSATLTSPVGSAIDLAGQNEGRRVRYQSHQTEISGRYDLEVGLSGEPIAFVVRRPAGESDPTPMSDRSVAEIERMIPAAQTVGVVGGETSAAGERDAGGRAVWFCVIAGLLAAIIGDALISHRIARRRTAATGISSTTPDIAVAMIGGTPRPTVRPAGLQGSA